MTIGHVASCPSASRSLVGRIPRVALVRSCGQPFSITFLRCGTWERNDIDLGTTCNLIRIEACFALMLGLYAIRHIEQFLARLERLLLEVWRLPNLRQRRAIYFPQNLDHLLSCKSDLVMVS